MKSVENFFLYCSGVDLHFLDKCPSDRHKYVGIGATVFFTGVFAFMSSAYALFTVFDSYVLSAVFGLVWGLMIFNLDRYIVLSMKRYGSWFRDLFVALPRLALAILLALVISKPLEMKIFEKEIKAELVQMEQEVYKKQEDQVKLRYQSQIDDKRVQIDVLKNEIAVKTALRDSLSRRAIQEADGTGGSRQQNLGPIYMAKKAEADLAAGELSATLATHLPSIQSFENEVKTLEATIQTEVTSLQRSRYDGLAARMEALSRLTTGSMAIFYASMFITLLFVAIETAPIVVKLISYRSPYDHLLHEHEHVFEMATLESTTLRNNTIRTKLRYDTETGAYLVASRIAAEKALIDHKLKEKLEHLKQQPYEWKLSV